MTAADWAYAPSAEPTGTLLSALLAADTADARTDLLVSLGAFARSCDDRALFAATADNVVVDAGGLLLSRALLDEVTPLDRAASSARIAWYLAWQLTSVGALGAEHPDLPLDDHAVRLGAEAGLGVSMLDVERFREHEARTHAALRGFDHATLERDLRAIGWLTPRRLAAGERLDARSSAVALTRAYDALVAARRDRDAAEALAVDAAASRALAQSLGEELERDEWIRARLRTVKGTRAARALIEARKRLLGRTDG